MESTRRIPVTSVNDVTHSSNAFETKTCGKNSSTVVMINTDQVKIYSFTLVVVVVVAVVADVVVVAVAVGVAVIVVDVAVAVLLFWLVQLL